MEDMTYKQTLELARKYDIRPIMLEVASEVYCINGIANDKDYEYACDTVKWAYLKSEGIAVGDLANALRELLDAGQDLRDISYDDLIEIASY